MAKLDASGQHLWSRRFGASGWDGGRSIAVDGSGNVLLTGSFQGTVDFGGGPLTSAGDYDIFVVKLDTNGQHLWGRRFGDSGRDRGRSIAVDGVDNILLTGDFEGTVDFDGGPFTSAGGYDVFVVKLNP